MGLLSNDFSENFELGFNDVFSLLAVIDFPLNITYSGTRRLFYNFDNKDIAEHARLLGGVMLTSDSKGRIRPNQESLIQTVVDKFIAPDSKNMVLEAEPYASIASSDNKIYIAIMTKQPIAPANTISNHVVCRILLCAK